MSRRCALAPPARSARERTPRNSGEARAAGGLCFFRSVDLGHSLNAVAIAGVDGGDGGGGGGGGGGSGAATAAMAIGAVARRWRQLLDPGGGSFQGCNVMSCNGMLCTVMQWHAMYCNAMQCNIM